MHPWLQKHREAVAVGLFQGLVFGIILGVVVLLLRRPVPANIVIGPMETSAQLVAASTATVQPIMVYVLGAVENPGVYQLPQGSRVQDVVLHAGGLSLNADPAGINLAERIRDGQQIFVPVLGQAIPILPTPAAQLTSGTVSSGAPININTADVDALCTLPGIGPVIAQRIVDYRQQNGPFALVEDVTRVSGIGQATLAKIRDHITVH